MLGALAFVATLGIATTTSAQVSTSFDIRRATEVVVTPQTPDLDPGWPDQPALDRLRSLNGVVHAGRRLIIGKHPVTRTLGTATQPYDVFGLDALAAVNPHLLLGRTFDTFHDQSATAVVLLAQPVARSLGISRVNVAGAVSIANAAAATITTRAAEIGLRRALGARPAHIFAQLVGETAALGAAGGLAGMLLGIAAVAAVSLATAGPPCSTFASPPCNANRPHPGPVQRSSNAYAAPMDPTADIPDVPGSAGRGRVNDYDSFADAYAAENETSLANAYYERPAMLALAGDIAGRRILDAGCGSGSLTSKLHERGAIVTGIDASAAMLALARRRLGADVALHQVDLRDALPFVDGAFDDVIASLVLHYLPDWGPTLAELARVLKPGGRLVASVDHPFVAYTLHDPRPDYFATTSYTFDWRLGGKPTPIRLWRQPLHAMVDAFTTAGLRLATISEPQPDPAARDLFPEGFRDLSTRPAFLFFVVEKPASRG